MKNENPSGRRLRMATAGQRALTVLMLLVFAGLVWAARSGRYDGPINRMADRLGHVYDQSAATLRGIFRKH